VIGETRTGLWLRPWRHTMSDNTRDELEQILRDYAAMRIHLQPTIDKILALTAKPEPSYVYTATQDHGTYLRAHTTYLLNQRYSECRASKISDLMSDTYD
jgi:hypothetical protein